jgi:hypothetical protein
MNLPSSYYGEGVETAAIQSGAPLAKTADVRGLPTGQVQAAAQEAVTPLYAPSQRPDEPVTAGIAMGAGPGPEVLGLNQVNRERLSDTLAQLLPYDDTGEITILYERALARGL